MKRALSTATALICIGLLTSCSLLPSPRRSFYDGDEKLAATQMRQIAHAVKDQDTSELKGLFSPRAREKATDLDAGLKYFLAIFPSGVVTWETRGTGESGADEYSSRVTELFGNYKVMADGSVYELYFAYLPVNDFHPESVGIYALGIEPYDAEGYTASGTKKPFWVWTSQYDINNKYNPTGEPGVYIPKK